MNTGVMFAEAAVAALPSMACTGYVSEIGEGKVSEKGVYYVQPITIAGTGASKTVRFNFLYRPEWLTVTDGKVFNPSSLISDYGDEGRKMEIVYRRNINGKDAVSALKGLAGSEQRFAELAAALLVFESEDDVTAEAVTEILRNFFEDGSDYEVGYILKQRRDKTEELDEHGKNVYQLANGYEISDWFLPTDAQKQKLVRRAKASKTPFVLAFDQD